MVDRSAFWDKLARRYAARPISNVDAYRQTMDRVRAHLRPSDEVLEIGCGTAATAILLAPEVRHITASDFSAEMVRIGRERASEAGVVNVTNVQGTLGDAVLGTGPYDAVLAFSFLHLLRDPAGAARSVHALLKPGGLFISKTPCLSGIYGLFRIPVAALRAAGKAPYVKFMGPAQLEALIVSAGFEIIETGDYPDRPPRHLVVARKR